MIKIFAFDEKNHTKHYAGDIEGTTFIKRVDHAKHFMKISNSYAIQYSTFTELGLKGVKKIKIIETNGKTYISTLKSWLEHGKHADYGAGTQQFLSLAYMKEWIPKTDLDQQIDTKVVLGQMAKTPEWEKLRQKLH